MNVSYSSGFNSTASIFNQFMIESMTKFSKYLVQQACFVTKASYYCNVNGITFDEQGLNSYFTDHATLVDALMQLETLHAKIEEQATIIARQVHQKDDLGKSLHKLNNEAVFGISELELCKRALDRPAPKVDVVLCKLDILRDNLMSCVLKD